MRLALCHSTRHCPVPSPCSAHGATTTPLVPHPPRAAALIKASLDLRLEGGAVIAVPIPQEHEAAGAEVEAAIAGALREAEAKGIAGAKVLPHRGRGPMCVLLVSCI